MLKKALIALVITIIALASNGAGPAAASVIDSQDVRLLPAVPANPEGAGESGDEVREEFHQTYPLSATGRVSVENLNGGVQIKVWDRAAVQVDAVKRAYRKERLAEATISVNSTPENIRIKTEYPDGEQNFRGDDRRYDNPAVVDYSLTVPRKAILESVELVNGSLDIEGVEGSVKASSINGRVSARGLMGEAKLSTINGPLQATFTHLDEAKPINLQSVNGSVTLVIPSNSNAAVKASTVHGGISNDFGLQVRHGEYVGNNLDGQIGTGGPRIKLGNVNGGIHITHAQDGLTLSPAVSRRVEGEQTREELREVLTEDIARQVEAATSSIAERESARAARVESARVAREAQRQVDVALRQAQREIERAQAQVQRETQQQVREQIREQIRANARARGVGVGGGIGTGGGRFTSQESKTFTVSGVPRVNVGTYDGQIVVHGWDKSEVMYTATKRAGEQDALKNISINSEQQGSTISINARSEENNGSTELEVYVPRRSSLHISSDDGRLTVEGVNGDLTLRTGDGAIEVTNSGGQLQVNTGDGRIRVADFNGQLDARTGDGTIALEGTFNGLTARTGSGTISLTVPAGSNFTIETNAEDGVNNEGLPLTEDVAPSARVKRWKVGNGGKVFILNTGDGKIFLRSR